MGFFGKGKETSLQPMKKPKTEAERAAEAAAAEEQLVINERGAGKNSSRQVPVVRVPGGLNKKRK